MAQNNVSQTELNKSYSTTQVNDSSLITFQAGEAITDVRCRAVKFDENGNVILAGAGDAPFGVGIITNNVNLAAGADVDVQYKNIGLVYTGAAVAKGGNLSVDANGCFIPTASSAYVAAIALENASAAGVYVKALLKMGNGSAEAESE